MHFLLNRFNVEFNHQDNNSLDDNDNSDNILDYIPLNTIYNDNTNNNFLFS